jgi:CheY-like chemotaxis protein
VTWPDEQDAKTVPALLTDKGYAVAAAHTAMSGLQLAVSEHPDVVVLDLGLPDLDGREVLRMLRAVSSVPIIVATARHRGRHRPVPGRGRRRLRGETVRRSPARRKDPGCAAPGRRAR